MERMDKGDLLHIGAAYVEVHTFKGKDYVTVKDFSTTTNALSKEILELEEENKKLKSDLAFERAMLDNVRAEYKSLQNVNKKLNIKVASLEGEIKGLNSTIEKLREELSAYDREYYDEDKKAKDIYKKQHSMGFSDFGGYDE